ncbi:exopolysaccharide biosynthesis polyprenyl glycosylphosphotransferase [Anaerospora hongkongensis]|uniref:Exopolysaccharide biosynthesis polyprenyl glycosylphosphotransferase n=1 Tax=Anaerospora hongkongensis TaxID=244830 RepID=A0A4R1PXS4_9FIRM|nr:sugar transferase [Anaerospora hongkongensis]TCL36064.1 exopolysaccharide biosynthesis polyprenyl glycosylphosphotransferase [Anaerospora hongkongensis]
MQRRFPMLSKLILLLGDIALLLLASYLAIVVVFYGSMYQPDFSIYYNMAPVMIIAAGILFNINGMFSLARKRYSELLLSLAVALFNLFIIIMATSFFLREFSYSRSVLIVTMVLQFILLAVWKYAFWRAERALLTPKNALLIGSQVECFRVITRLQAQPQLNYNVRYVCMDYESESWKKVSEDIDVMIVCADLSLKDKAEIVHFCHTNGKQIFLIPDVYEIFCSGVELDKIDDIPVFRPTYLRPTLEQQSLKRILDIVVSGTAILFLWPIFIFVAIAIKLDCSGPILYSQVRTGLDEREFKVYKFRSMRVDAEKITGPVLAGENDPRITRLGKFLRATRLDELPQLFNVLLGDMSIVGPRPERPFFVEKFKQEITEYVYRHNVKPGITGLAQVYGKYNTTPYDKLVYDLIYIQKCNVISDLVIMLQTVKVLVTKSSTEGVGANKLNPDLSRYQIDEMG